jgi:DNA-binding transcriptional regulator GbsR (MarR family)
MGQQEVFDYLKRNKPRWVSSHELSEGLGISIGSITMSLKKLRKASMVRYRKAGLRNAYEYAFKKGE